MPTLLWKSNVLLFTIKTETASATSTMLRLISFKQREWRAICTLNFKNSKFKQNFNYFQVQLQPILIKFLKS